MRLLIAVSGSPHSEATVRLGGEMARYAMQVPTILTVIGSETDRPHADAALADDRELLKSHVPEVLTLIRVGHPAEEIIREIEQGGYDLVIVGDKERHDRLTRFFLGSTTQRVVEHAPCSVIIAKGQVRPIRRILLCDSGAENSPLLKRIARLADLMGDAAEITVLHVMSQISAGPGVAGHQLRASAEELIQEGTPEGELLERDVKLLERSNVHLHPKVRHGMVVEEILEEAHSAGYDLVVIGAHRGEGWGRFLLDDLARRIVEKTDLPIMVVK